MHFPRAPRRPAPADASAKGTPAGRQVIDARKAAFTLIANSFRPLGDVAKGNAPFDAADVKKRAARLAFLAELLSENFTDASNIGEPETKAKPEIWANRADFDKKLADFKTHAAALVQVSATENSASDSFKAAIATVGGDCKGCHDVYKVK